MVFLYVKGQGETLFPLGREDPICKGGKKRMKKKALKRIVSLLLGALLLLGCTLPAGAQTTWRNPFTDVKESDWFYPHVQWAAGSGVLSGTSATTFEPDAPMTRGMFVTALANWEGIDPAQYPGSRFQDVAEGAWYAAPIQWAASWGIASGTGQGDFTFDAPTLDTFSPLAPLTRQDAVVLLYQYMSALDVEMESASGQLGRFPDGEDTALYARNAMEWAITNQILQGSDGMLLPGGTLTRAQAAALLDNFSAQAPQRETMEAPASITTITWTYTAGEQEYQFRIPQIQAEGVDTVEINRAIVNRYTYAVNNSAALVNGGYQPIYSDVGYYYSVFQGFGDFRILSLVTYDKWNEDYSFAVWNVDLSTGQLVESAQLLAKAGYRVDSYSQKIAAALEGAFDKYLALWEEQAGPMSQEEAVGYRAATLSPANYALDGGEVDFFGGTLQVEGTPLFVDATGQLWAIGRIWHAAGSQQVYKPLALPGMRVLPFAN